MDGEEIGATELWLVRHGERVGNFAASAAGTAGADVIEVGLRDADVALTPTGQAQAAALGTWLAGLPTQATPQMVWGSPYLRAAQTAEVAAHGCGAPLPIRDERLRDRNIKELERLLEAPAALDVPAELPGAVQRAAHRYDAVITCQDVIADTAGSVWEAAPNCIGLGTSGSGDVFGGVVAESG